MSEAKYVIMIHGRSYESWNFLTSDTYNPIEIDEPVCCDPAKHKLFSRDVISWPNGFAERPRIEYSPTRNQLISGVLELDGNRTYGRTANGKKLYYKCVPNDRYLPAFLVAYTPKLEFNKKMENRFVLIRFAEWTDKQQHPVAVLEQVLGPTSNLQAFYEYQLHSRSLISNDGFGNFKERTANVFGIRDSHCRATKTTPEQEIAERPEYKIDDRTILDDNIFTIDPKGSADYDDAFRVTRCLDPDPNNSNIICVSVYISSVYAWINQLDLWSAFSMRVSTIYLPDYRRPMIPALLSEQLCSLAADGNTKFAVKWDVPVDVASGKILLEQSTFSHVAIKPTRNYTYDSPDLEKNAGFRLLREATLAVDAHHSTDSHDVVAFWMVKMNSAIGTLLAAKYGAGIFRQAGYKDPAKSDNIQNNIPIEIVGEARRLISSWKNSTGVYCLLSDNKNVAHEFLDAENYVHATSPIRRIVDLLNQMVFLENHLGVVVSDSARHFLDFWMQPKQIEYINATMRSIRKVQMDCDTVAKCHSHPEWIMTTRTHRGVIFDRIQKTDATYSYMVYLQETKILTRIHSVKKEDNYTSHNFVLTISPIDHVIRAGFSQ